MRQNWQSTSAGSGGLCAGICVELNPEGGARQIFFPLILDKAGANYWRAAAARASKHRRQWRAGEGGEERRRKEGTSRDEEATTQE